MACKEQKVSQESLSETWLEGKRSKEKELEAARASGGAGCIVHDRGPAQIISIR